MKRNYLIFISIISILTLFNSGCKKGDLYYYDFKNQDAVFDGTIYSYLVSKNGLFDSLLVVLDRSPDLRLKLNNPDSNLTLFAPTNSSFELAIKSLNVTRNRLEKTPLYLEDLQWIKLDSLINYYAFSQIYDTDTEAKLKNGRLVPSLKYDYIMNIQYRVLNASGFENGGSQQFIFSDTNNSKFQKFWKDANTSAVNIHTKNGIIHILAPGHDFGYGKLTSKFSAQ